MTNFTFDDIKKLDNALYDLAAYDFFRGFIIPPKSQDEAIDMERKIANKFNEFKRLIQKGDKTFEEIKQDVLSKNGPILQKEYKNLDDFIDQQFEKINSEENLPDLYPNQSIKFNQEDTTKMITYLVDQLLGPPKNITQTSQTLQEEQIDKNGENNKKENNLKVNYEENMYNKSIKRGRKNKNSENTNGKSHKNKNIKKTDFIELDDKPISENDIF